MVWYTSVFITELWCSVSLFSKHYMLYILIRKLYTIGKCLSWAQGLISVVFWKVRLVASVLVYCVGVSDGDTGGLVPYLLFLLGCLSFSELVAKQAWLSSSATSSHPTPLFFRRRETPGARSTSFLSQCVLCFYSSHQKLKRLFLARSLSPILLPSPWNELVHWSVSLSSEHMHHTPSPRL